LRLPGNANFTWSPAVVEGITLHGFGHAPRSSVQLQPFHLLQSVLVSLVGSISKAKPFASNPIMVVVRNDAQFTVLPNRSFNPDATSWGWYLWSTPCSPSSFTSVASVATG